MENEPLLSIVIISRNIERYIGRCIEAVLEASRHIESKEILLVDSASTDSTIDLAKKYPIKILRIDDSAPLSPSAGRYIGFLNANGRYIHFQDGDSLLDKDWFKNALPFLESHLDIGGVVGGITQEKYDNFVVTRWIEESKKESTSGYITSYWEDILLRRKVIEKVGPFNPWINAREEGEFSSRILQAGLKLYRLPVEMSHHLGGEDESNLTLIKRRVNNTIALGKILRYHLNEKEIRNIYIKESKFLLVLTINYFFLILSLLLINIVDNTMLVTYFSLTVISLVYILIIINRRNFKEASLQILSCSFRWPFLIFGFLSHPKNPLQYPENFSIVKQ